MRLKSKFLSLVAIFAVLSFSNHGLSQMHNHPYREVICAKQESALHYNFKNPDFQEKAGAADFDLYYQRMEWLVDPAVLYISGTVTSYVKAEVNGLEKACF